MTHTLNLEALEFEQFGVVCEASDFVELLLKEVMGSVSGVVDRSLIIEDDLLEHNEMSMDRQFVEEQYQSWVVKLTAVKCHNHDPLIELAEDEGHVSEHVGSFDTYRLDFVIDWHIVQHFESITLIELLVSLEGEPLLFSPGSENFGNVSEASDVVEGVRMNDEHMDLFFKLNT